MVAGADESAGIGPATTRAMAAIAHLSDFIGPRPPTGTGERAAAEWVAAQMRELGTEPVIERFPAYRSFGLLYGPMFGLAVVAGLLPKRLRTTRLIVALAGVGIGYWEGEFRSWGALKRAYGGRSQNVVASFEPAGERRGGDEPVPTVCFVSHADSSRSGLMFHPRVAGRIGPISAGVGIAMALQAVGAVVARILRPGSGGSSSRLLRFLAGVTTACRGAAAAALALVVERELRGCDVPGANDNASGVGACLGLAALVTERRPENLRVVILVTGAEEAGVLGMRRFLEVHDTEGWLFVNFDGVGADAPLRHLTCEGGPLSSRAADRGLVELIERIGDAGGSVSRPLKHGSGLPYDATAVLARGGRAVTITAQDGPIPNYHWPTDRFEAIYRETVEQAIRLGWEMLSAIDAAPDSWQESDSNRDSV